MFAAKSTSDITKLPFNKWPVILKPEGMCPTDEVDIDIREKNLLDWSMLIIENKIVYAKSLS
jgi:hypothetical protein